MARFYVLGRATADPILLLLILIQNLIHIVVTDLATLVNPAPTVRLTAGLVQLVAAMVVATRANPVPPAPATAVHVHLVAAMVVATRANPVPPAPATAALVRLPNPNPNQTPNQIQAGISFPASVGPARCSLRSADWIPFQL